MWCIVKFPTENNCIAVVPRAWILEDGKCLWPPGKNPQKIAKSVKNSEIPADLDSWKKSECIVIHLFENYESARCKLDTATFTSDLTEDDVARKPIGKRINQRSNDSGSKNKRVKSSLVMYSTLANVTDPLTDLTKNTDHSVTEHSNLKQNPNNSVTEHSNLPENDPAGSPTIVESDSDSVTYLFPKSNVAATSNFEKEVIVALTDIKLRLCKMENSLEYRNSIPVYSVFEDKDFEDLPISDENDLHILSQKVQSDKKFRRKLVAQFGAIGGRKPSLHVNNILTDLLTDTLARSYSWLGKRGNKSFARLQLLNVIFEAVMKYKKSSSLVTKDDVVNFIQAWLRHANDRIQGKKKAELQEALQINDHDGNEVVNGLMSDSE
ncbi:unnamed protein product [Allacma fusca]|uniref:DUF4806 domain-containing protein n=1 Tax=Allacma fusca TaxID=39272 RepID=A0A8J2KSU9_9HEXA|nr:unnamed protein product [Allacma fusca]